MNHLVSTYGTLHEDRIVEALLGEIPPKGQRQEKSVRVVNDLLSVIEWAKVIRQEVLEGLGRSL